jgi:pyruvate dehydrogenase E2 component (dihydrolipoamide acetyltransferase)
MTSLHADIKDEGSAPLVLLHGFGGFHGVWDGVRNALPDGAPTIAYDLPGHGRSLPLREAMSPRRAADAVLADLAERAPATFHLAGHSMGGAIAMLMALTAPERVASLTLLAPGGFGDEINEAVLVRFGLAISPEELAETLKPMCGDGFLFPLQSLEALSAVRRMPGQADALEELAGKIAKGGRQGVIPRDRVAGLTMPVRIAWGESDRVLPPRHAEGLPAAFDVRMLAGAGHMLLDERPEEVAAVIGGVIT